MEDEQNTKNAQQNEEAKDEASKDAKAGSDKAEQKTEEKTTSSSESYDAILDKLDEIIGKRTEGVAKSAINANVPEGEDGAAILEAWKARRDARTKELETNYATAKSENESLKAQIAQMRIEKVARDAAGRMGVAPNAMDYIAKLADFTDVITEKGEIDGEKVTAAIQKVLDDVPQFKANTAAQAGFKIGGDGGNSASTESDDERARRIMGLGPKK